MRACHVSRERHSRLYAITRLVVRFSSPTQSRLPIQSKGLTIETPLGLKGPFQRNISQYFETL